MLGKAWALARDTVEGFVADEAMTRGAAIACYRGPDTRAR